jgi:ubiquinone/menaquinone biosynthesis C-methylase UbiE
MNIVHIEKEDRMVDPHKAHRGLAMEGFIASWYARNTGRELGRFQRCAAALQDRLPPGACVLEVAPGPGYLAIELARAGHRVTGVDISHSFIRIASENAARAGVAVDFRHGDAARLPLPDGSFDLVVCMAAFKNFTDPVGALDEFHRVLRPRGSASVFDLRREAPMAAIAREVQEMNLSAWNAAFTRLTFRFLLLRSAYTRAELERMVARSRFRRGEIRDEGIGFELRLTRHS